MRRSATGIILGYHGCDAKVADALVSGTVFEFSRNEYDWLGHGVYFWENDPERALHWAKSAPKTAKPIDTPAVVGAAIDLGLCLDLTTQASLEVIKQAYDLLKATLVSQGKPLLKNSSEFKRELDCAVFNFLYESMPDPKFQTVRGVLTEGGPLYEGAHIKSRTHVQIAVRDLSCIKGVFRVSS
jgi:hypothetical protein